MRLDDDGSGDIFVDARAEAMPAAMLDLASLFIERPLLRVTDRVEPRREGVTAKGRGTGGAPMSDGLRDRLGNLMGVTDAVRRPGPGGKRN